MGLPLASCFALNITDSWCQENEKQSQGGAVRGEIQEENSKKEKETGKLRDEWGDPWENTGYSNHGKMTVVGNQHLTSAARKAPVLLSSHRLHQLC